MKNIMLKTVLVGSFAMLLLNPMQVLARQVKGQAAIQNGNLEAARIEARKDAMRSFVEAEVGTYINSQTETVNYMVVRDKILSKSEGYVLTKAVISEQSLGDIYEVVLDLEAGKNSVPMAQEEVYKQLENAQTSDSARNGIDIAVMDDDPSLTYTWSNYVAKSLKSQGYEAYTNDNILKFLSENLNTMDDLKMVVGLRQAGKVNYTGANSIARGRVGIERSATPTNAGTYRAVAKITVQIVGYESSNIDVESRFATAFSDTPDGAEREAKEKVIMEAAGYLAQQSAKTIQKEQGTQIVKTTLIFKGITNKAGDRTNILSAINAMGLRMIRGFFAPDGSFKAFVTSSGGVYSNADEIRNLIADQLKGKYPNVVPEQEANGDFVIKLQ